MLKQGREAYFNSEVVPAIRSTVYGLEHGHQLLLIYVLSFNNLRWQSMRCIVIHSESGLEMERWDPKTLD